MAAVDTYQDLLRIAVASAGNDHRLGGHEAPPAIITIFLGDETTEILSTLAKNQEFKPQKNVKTEHGIKYIASFDKDHSDRNRTSPFAFTGNKFEFRMPGSAMDIATCNTVLNTAVAEILGQVSDRLEKNDHPKNMVKDIIIELFNKHQRILFNGNGYSEE
jgi:glutamine synthetase